MYIDAAIANESVADVDDPIEMELVGGPMICHLRIHLATAHTRVNWSRRDRSGGPSDRVTLYSIEWVGTPFRDCEIHHVTYWEHDGRTDLDNLLPLSPRWHHLIHDSGWRLHLHPDRSIDLYRPDTTFHRHIPPPIPMTRRSIQHPTVLAP